MSLQASFNDFIAQVAEIRPQIDAALRRVLDRGWFILGPEVDTFESQFADYLGVQDVVTVANGTDAIQLALMALGIGSGDEVICPALTAAPTALAVMSVGAYPVFADIDPHTFTIDPTRLGNCLSEKTRAILPVHLYGLAADVPAIMTFAQQYGLQVIEDTAQAHGAMVSGKLAGTIAPIGCFSFYPTKNLGAYGDGGAVVTNDTELGIRLRQLRNLGQRGRFEHIVMGLNSRLDEMQAAILQVQLVHLKEHNDARRERAAWYRELLSDALDLQLPFEPEDFCHVYHLYVVKHPRRDALRDHLRQLGIGCDVHYPLPLNRQPAFADCRVSSDGLTVSEQSVGQILSLPMYPQLSRAQIESVAEGVRSFTS